ncbi:peptidoglycan-binding domain-containing protein [Clostridium sp. UBA1652]|uniref:peptidoglycan-binding domain-containing protein n=1 Tax=Clostridium sp. UBA1652 TaxID=1946348 RepID=UPI00257E8003|nr:peptidoglycan-binding domain-containing protein [Clostridium sp. UBA1652]
MNKLCSDGLATDGYLGYLTIAVFDRALVAQGQRNDLVRVIQKRLIQLGYKLSNYGADGVYGVGGETYRAVVQFQRDRGLEDDSLVGKNTLKALFRK